MDLIRKKYQQALESSGITIWEYNIKENSIKWGNEVIYEALPESYIAKGYVHPSSVDAFRKLHSDLLTGKAVVEGDFQIFDQSLSTNSFENPVYKWIRITYSIIFNKAGKPISAIGISRCINLEKEAELKYLRSMHFRTKVRDDIIASCEINLTERKLVYVEDLYGSHENLSGISPFDSVLNGMLTMVTNKDDEILLQNRFSFNALLENWEKGIKYSALEYRRKELDGQIVWVHASIRMVEDPISHNIIGYGIIKNINQQKKIELALHKRAEKDILTGVYNLETFEQIVIQLMKDSAETQSSCAMAIFDVDEYASLSQKNDSETNSKVLKELADIINIKTVGQKVMGRLDIDEFVVFYLDGSNISTIRKSIEDIRQTFEMPYVFNNFSVTVSVGVALGTLKQNTYATLLEKAKIALQKAKNTGRNRFCEYNPLQQNDLELIEQEAESSFCRVSEDENDLLLKAAFSLISAKNFSGAMVQVLKDIGDYFGSSNAFLVELNKEGAQLKHLYHWDRDGEFREGMNSQIASFLFPMWIKEFKNNKRILCYPDITELADRYPVEVDILKQWNIQSVLLVPLIIADTIVGFLGLDNYTKNEDNRGLLNSIEHFISSEITRKQELEKQQYLSEHDILTGLYNRNMYESYCLELKSDSLSSLGIVYTSVTGLKVINERFGPVYGNSILVFIGSALQEYFPGGASFRYDGDEFITFVENCTQDALIESVENFHRKGNKTFENNIAVGYSWMDTDISVESLLKNADQMLLQNKTKIKVMKENGTDFIKKIYDDLKKSINEGVFQVYFQPKESIGRKKIVGAEALIRMIHPQYGIVPPDRFVPLLEKENLIQHIDLFVFEEVCKILQRWDSQGKDMIIISVNFSRKTLLEENLLETINAIQEKYGIPRQYIEIEITESLGEVDRDSMIHMGKKISKEGYLLTLDDFGSKYSNISILSAVTFNVLKIDKSLVKDVFSNPRSKVIVRNFIDSCRSLGINTVAEGVETMEQYEVLKEMGCDCIQGYFINKPLSVVDFEKKYI